METNSLLLLVWYNDSWYYIVQPPLHSRARKSYYHTLQIHLSKLREILVDNITQENGRIRLRKYVYM